MDIRVVERYNTLQHESALKSILPEYDSSSFVFRMDLFKMK